MNRKIIAAAGLAIALGAAPLVVPADDAVKMPGRPAGVVQLKGNFASDSERALAQNLAAKVEGVKSVENKLAVKP